MRFIAILLLVSSCGIAHAADLREPPVPSRFTCSIVKALYKHYSKNYSQEDMINFLRSKDVPEIKIQSAKRCLA